MENRSKIYLDWNVIVEFLEENFKWLEDVIFSNHESIDIPFTSVHIAEATNIKLSNKAKTKNEIDRRLNFLSNISSNLYFVNDMIETGYKVETPHNVYQTLNVVSLDFNPDKLFSNLIDFDSLKEGRKKLDLDPNILNNVKPTDAIKEIDKIITLCIESFLSG